MREIVADHLSVAVWLAVNVPAFINLQRRIQGSRLLRLLCSAHLNYAANVMVREGSP